MEHLEVHTGDKPFLCEQCDSSITTPESGMKVQVIVDTGAKMVQCDMCGKKFTRASNLTGHIVVHKTEKPYQCDRCRQYFESPAMLKTHMDIHLNENRFECETCNKTFSSHGNLVKHKRLHETSKPFPCNICKKSYLTESYLKSHMWEHVEDKPFECEICNKKFPLVLHLKRHLAVHAEVKPHVCEICNKQFPTPGNLKRHRQTHILYECQACGKQYSKLDQLKEHLSDHLEDKPFSCEVCDKRFVTEIELKAHKWVHTRDKHPYFCSICKSKFALSKQLKDHKAEVHGETQKLKLRKSKVVYSRHDQSTITDDNEDPLVDDEFSVPRGRIEPEEVTYVYDPNKRYPCEVCGKTFKTLRIKTQHVRLHDGVRPYQCEVCGNSFRTRTNLQRHRRLHNRDNPFQCTVCDKSYKTIGALKTHMWEHNDIKPYECEICEKKFSQEMHVKRHMIVHSVDKKFKCDLCHMTFSQSGNLKRHKTTHSVKLKSKCPICEKMFRTLTEMKLHLEEHNTTKRYQCRLCHRRYASEAILKGHMWGHAEKRFHCKKCNKRFASRAFLRRHMTIHAQQEKESAYQCDICQKRFLKLGNFKVHVTLHSTLSRLKCSLCSVSFSSNRYLDKHMKEKHPDSRTFRCDFCEETFLTTYGQLRHIQKHHVEESKTLHKCDECNQEFSTEDALISHQIDHGVENPFKCSVCDQSFSNKLRLQLHNRIHRDVFHCRYCKLVFSNLKEKRDHVRSMDDEAHKPFHCTTCGKTFHSKQRLQRHTLIHTGERPFACKVCQRRFTQAAHLKDHMRLHTGERPYACTRCERRFTHARTLKSHLEVCKGMDKSCPCGCGKNNKPHKAFQCQLCQKRFRFEKNFKLHNENGSCANKDCPCGCLGDIEKHSVPEEGAGTDNSSKARMLLHNIEMQDDPESEMSSKDESDSPEEGGENEKVSEERMDCEVTNQTVVTPKKPDSVIQRQPHPTIPSVNMENTFKLVDTILEAAEVSAGRSVTKSGQQWGTSYPNTSSTKPQGTVSLIQLHCHHCSKMFQNTQTLSNHVKECHPNVVCDISANADVRHQSTEPFIKTEPMDIDDDAEIARRTAADQIANLHRVDYSNMSAKNIPVSKKPGESDSASSSQYRIVYLGPESMQAKTGNDPANQNTPSTSARFDPKSIPESIEATSSMEQLIEAATLSESICMTQERRMAQEGVLVAEATDSVVSVISSEDHESTDPQVEAVTLVTDDASGLSETLVLDSIPADAVRIIATRPDNDTDTIIIKIEYDDTV